MNNLKKFALAAAISAMSLPMLLSAQTFEDHTKIRQLIGKPPTAATDMPSCPSGSTLSGGQCVLISNQVSGQVITKVGVLSCFYDGGCSPMMGICVAGAGNPSAVIADTGWLACPTGSGWVPTEHQTVTPP